MSTSIRLVEGMFTNTLTPYSFSPFNSFMASMASGIGRPPLMSTPSISKAKAKVSALGISGGVQMGVPGVSGDDSEGEEEESSRFMEASSFRAVSIAVAKLSKPPWCVFDRRWKSLSGTTTKWSSASMSLSVAVMEERRRRAGLPTGGDSSASDVAILAEHSAAECGESGGYVGSHKKTLEKGKIYSSRRLLRDGVGLIRIWSMGTEAHRPPPSP